MRRVPDEDGIVGAHPHRPQDRCRALRTTVEAVGEHDDLGEPTETAQLGVARRRVLVRTDTPAGDARQHLLDAGEGRHDVGVVAGDVVVHRHTESGALHAHDAPHADVDGVDPERLEGGEQRRVGVEQRAVEVEDHDPFGHPGHRSGPGAAGPPAEGTTPRLLIPSGPARLATTGVEQKRSEVEPIHLVGIAERARQGSGFTIGGSARMRHRSGREGTPAASRSRPCPVAPRRDGRRSGPG